MKGYSRGEEPGGHRLALAWPPFPGGIRWEATGLLSQPHPPPQTSQRQVGPWGSGQGATCRLHLTASVQVAWMSLLLHVRARQPPGSHHSHRIQKSGPIPTRSSISHKGEGSGGIHTCLLPPSPAPSVGSGRAQLLGAKVPAAPQGTAWEMVSPGPAPYPDPCPHLPKPETQRWARCPCMLHRLWVSLDLVNLCGWAQLPGPQVSPQTGNLVPGV